MYFWQNLTHSYPQEPQSHPDCLIFQDLPSQFFFPPHAQWNSSNISMQTTFQTLTQTPCVYPEPAKSPVKGLKAQLSTSPSDCLIAEQKVSRNLKSTIARDFIKSLKNDTSSILIAKRILKSEVSVKNFMECLHRKVPDEGKYIRLKTLHELCNNRDEPGFSQLFRVLLKTFLRNQYPIAIINKKKKRSFCLQACRELEAKLFRGQSGPDI